MDDDITYASFLLRFWRMSEASPSAPDTHWLFEIESVQSGHTWQGESLEALIAWLKGQADGDSSFTLPHSKVSGDNDVS
ncbi:MAG TPA: hypothetical protein PLD25_21570 [Chloroflexota bacterium]|nr:hypothetical protein [Chloroflexota bacterium]